MANLVFQAATLPVNRLRRQAGIGARDRNRLLPISTF
jgi:hypothetical protein